jgi:putative ABC transport system permease protein
MNTISLLETTWHDLRYAARAYRGNPGFTIVALLSLMLGIGATTAVFSVIYGVLIAPYPYAKPGEIWAPNLHETKRNRTNWRDMSVEELLDLQKLPAIASAMGTGFDQVLLTGDRAPESLGAPRMSGDAFNFLGVPPVIGRTLQPTDETPAGEPEAVTVISYKLWHRLFDGNPSALGQKLILNRVPHTIVGVMPPRFGWYGNDSLWLPLGSSKRSPQRLSVIVRLRPGVATKVAEEQLQAFFLRLAAISPRDYPEGGFQARLRNYLDMTVASGEMQSTLKMLFFAVGLLLLISCANVANLQLARTAVRAREIGIRLSIGAGRWRVLRQLLTESVFLSVAGGALGVGFAILLTQVITAMMPEFYTPNEARVTVNLYVLSFSLGVSILTGVLFGLAPAVYSTRQNLSDSLREGSRNSGVGASGGRMRNVLVVAEVALSVVLLAGSALAIRSFVRLQKIDLGFRPEGVLNVGLPLPPGRYATVEARNQFARALTERVRALPGVIAVAIGNGGMPFGGPQSRFTINGQPIAGVGRITLGLVSGGYLRTLGIRLLRGREFTEAEVARGERVALINEAAIRLWPAGQSPIGQSVHIDLLARSPDPSVFLMPGSPEVTIIGILANTRNAGLSRDPRPAVYLPYTLAAPDFRQIAIRTQGNPMQILNPLRREVQALDKDQAILRPVSFDEILGEETVQPRFNMALFTFFALLGVALAAAGIFSVISYNVTRRTHEIGIRVALGATQANISRLVVGMGARLVSIGLAIGLIGTILVIRTVQTQVFDLALFDVPSAAAVVGLLTAVALLACYLPARRAARLDPTAALRQQ